MLKLLVIAVLAVGALAHKYDSPMQTAFDELRAVCRYNGAEDKMDEAQMVGITFVSRLGRQINIQSIGAEIKEAAPQGTLGDVIKKYCARTPQMKQCFHDFIDGISPCLGAVGRSRVADVKAGVDQLFDFVCYNEGNRIALFIAEAGPECVSAKSDAIQRCVETSRGSEASSTLTEQCAKYDQLTSCVVTALKECPSTYPGSMAESLFRDIRKESPCKNV